jgi:hypothetical protein
VTHPYRTRPSVAPAPPPEPQPLGALSMAFGLLCAVAGQALAGPKGALVATVVGVVLLVRRPTR